VKQPFEQVVATHGATVLRVCRGLLSVHDADDAWSATFLAALSAYPDLPSDANIEAWLVTIAHRKAIDVIRQAGRAALPVAQVPEVAATFGAPDGDDGDLWAAVRALPPRQRQVVAYRFLGGLAFAEIADITGGTVDAARRACADGLARLRRDYQANTPEGSES
jgi:RNA polymerase sigma factor (sigma-70 family)